MFVYCCFLQRVGQKFDGLDICDDDLGGKVVGFSFAARLFVAFLVVVLIMFHDIVHVFANVLWVAAAVSDRVIDVRSYGGDFFLELGVSCHPMFVLGTFSHGRYLLIHCLGGVPRVVLISDVLAILAEELVHSHVSVVSMNINIYRSISMLFEVVVDSLRAKTFVPLCHVVVRFRHNFVVEHLVGLHSHTHDISMSCIFSPTMPGVSHHRYPAEILIVLFCLDLSQPDFLEDR